MGRLRDLPPTSMRVVDIKCEAIDVLSFRLMEVGGMHPHKIAPGAHINVTLPNSIVTRPYSLTNGPEDTDHYSIAVKREPNSKGASLAMHEKIKVGDVLNVSEPRNNFPLTSRSSHTILLAAGIGITPLFSMSKHLKWAGRPYELIYFARSPDHAAFRDVLCSDSFGNDVRFEYGRSADEVSSLLRNRLYNFHSEEHLYICGPPPFIDSAVACSRHWPRSLVHTEHFSNQTTPDKLGDIEFQVTAAKTNQTFTVPLGTTIARVLHENGVSVDLSCEEGLCRTCVTRVLQGAPDHRDMCLTEEERASGLIAICVSRCSSDHLVLDI